MAPEAREYLGTVQGRHEPEAGQAMAEYAVIVAAIAVGCVLAALFLGVTIKGLFENSGGDSSIPAAPFTPPATTPGLTYPTGLEQCERGGWRDFAQFRNERECADYVRSVKP